MEPSSTNNLHTAFRLQASSSLLNSFLMTFISPLRWMQGTVGGGMLESRLSRGWSQFAPLKSEGIPSDGLSGPFAVAG